MKRVSYMWLCCIVMCLMFPLACQSRNTVLLDPAEAVAFMERPEGREDFLVLDVRTAEEFRQGHIGGARWLDYYAPDFAERFARLDRNATILLYCRSGNRTSRVSDLAHRLGFTRIFDLRGGILAWSRAGLPLTAGKEPKAP